MSEAVNTRNIKALAQSLSDAKKRITALEEQGQKREELLNQVLHDLRNVQNQSNMLFAVMQGTGATEKAH